jgi:hypothetical protein
MQTKKMPLAPIILVGDSFWNGLDGIFEAMGMDLPTPQQSFLNAVFQF